MVDIIVADDNSPRVNRIAERFNFKDVATIEKELELEKQAKEKEESSKDSKDKFIDEIMPKEKEEEITIPSNNNETVEKNLLEKDLNLKQNNKEKENFNVNKKSVKQELKEIKQEMKAKERDDDKGISVNKEKKKEAKHYKTESENYEGKRYKEPKHYENNNGKYKNKSKNSKSRRNSR